MHYIKIGIKNGFPTQVNTEEEKILRCHKVHKMFL